MLAGKFPACAEFDIVMATSSVMAGSPSELPPLERRAIAKAPPARSREFAAGRMAARKAMAYLGLSGIAIPRSAQRYPEWPSGLLGSISHSRNLAVAAVTRDRRLIGIGIDVEDKSFDNAPDIFCDVLTDDERMLFEGSPSLSPGEFLALVASCKEAAYKAVYPITEEYFDFRDVEVEFAQGSKTFRIRPRARLRSADLLGRGYGSFSSDGDQVFSMFVIGAASDMRAQ